MYRILEARDEDKVFCSAEYGEDCSDFEELMGLAGDTFFPPLSYTSEVFTIRSIGRVGETRSCVLSIVSRGDGAQFRTLFYQAEC